MEMDHDARTHTRPTAGRCHAVFDSRADAIERLIKYADECARLGSAGLRASAALGLFFGIAWLGAEVDLRWTDGVLTYGIAFCALGIGFVAPIVRKHGSGAAVGIAVASSLLFGPSIVHAISGEPAHDIGWVNLCALGTAGLLAFCAATALGVSAVLQRRASALRRA